MTTLRAAPGPTIEAKEPCWVNPSASASVATTSGTIFQHLHYGWFSVMFPCNTDNAGWLSEHIFVSFPRCWASSIVRFSENIPEFGRPSMTDPSMKIITLVIPNDTWLFAGHSPILMINVYIFKDKSANHMIQICRVTKSLDRDFQIDAWRCKWLPCHTSPLADTIFITPIFL